MALRMPLAAPDFDVTLHPLTPGQLVHRPLSGARPLVLTRDPGRWGGRVAINRVGRGDHAIGEDMETWLTAIAAAGGPVGEIRIRRDVVPVPANTYAAAVQAGPGHVRVTPTNRIPDATARQWVRIGPRMYRVVQVVIVGDFPILYCWPPALPDVGAVMAPGEWMQISLADAQRGGPDLPRMASFYGPWTVNFEEFPWPDR